MKQSEEMLRYAEIIAGELREIEQALIEDDQDGVEIVVNYANETILESITWVAQERPDLVRVEWLRTFGGPGCRIYFENDDHVVVRAYGMDGRAELSVYVPNLVGQVLDLATYISF